ncbi:glycosyltransferase family 2 protein [Rhodococcus sp. ARC_M5]|uniref:glycosyltransferase family 2 protein n=1 Tax=Rhodococcus sp. ARC_M5 TaxID=2928851 RepID=UPI001FB28E22|nr:glycosyltransferase [Rhodococcus sp. ARC_M5]MCJ0892081.1 hypothetical protein [Rhodococcus sp. ARC_M5]
MGIALLVVAYNSPHEGIDRLIESLADSKPHEECTNEIEVVVVQNDSGPAYKRNGAVTLQGHGNIGFGAGVRLALENSSSEIVAIANPDCYLEEGRGLRELIACLQNGPTHSIVSPLVVGHSGKIEHHAYGDWTFTPTRYLIRAWSRLVLQLGSSARIPRGLKLPGTFLIMNRDVANGLGPFDPKFFLYGEDRDMCRRARAMNIELLLCREAIAIHEGGVSAKSVPHIVTRGQAAAALEIARRKFGFLGSVLAGFDLLVTSRSSDIRKIRLAEIRHSFGREKT